MQQFAQSCALGFIHMTVQKGGDLASRAVVMQLRLKQRLYYLVLLPVLGSFQSYSLAADVSKVQIG